MSIQISIMLWTKGKEHIPFLKIVCMHSLKSHLFSESIEHFLYAEVREAILPKQFMHFVLRHVFLILIHLFGYVKQYSCAFWSILEGAWLCQTPLEAQAGVEGWGCWHCCSVWAGVFCLVLCWWDSWSRVYIHWLLCLSPETRR